MTLCNPQEELAMRPYRFASVLLAALALNSCETVKAASNFAGKAARTVEAWEGHGHVQQAGYSLPEPPPSEPKGDSKPSPADDGDNDAQDPSNPLGLGSTLALRGNLGKTSSDIVDYYPFKPTGSGQVAVSISNTTKANPQGQVFAEILLDGRRIAYAGWAVPNQVAAPNVKPTIYPDRVYFVKVTGSGGFAEYNVNLQLVAN